MFKTKTPPYKETLKEEIVNSIITAISFISALAGMLYLTKIAESYPNEMAIFASTVYGGSIVFMYLSSLLYHSIQHPTAKGFFKILDHCAIYVLIAGSYTPFCLLALQGTMGWAVFSIIWSLALLGIMFKTLYIDRFEKISVFLYILMGWGAVIMIKPLYLALPFEVFTLLVAGGITYTVGTIFFVWESKHYSHAIWHIFVYIASMLHFMALFLYLIH